MMAEWLAGLSAAMGLGILTSISPCPLATNIAAISYVGRRVGSAKLVFLTGLLYTAGRMLAYVILGLLLVGSLLSIPQVSLWLQKYMHLVLGPIMIVVGMFLLELIEFDMGGASVSDSVQQRVDAMGIWGALPLGLLFALSFCPTSAALFFGSLIPLSVKLGSGVVLPLTYGVGTAVPVLVFALLIAFGGQAMGQAFNLLSRIEWWARRLTGLIFVLVGIHFSLVYIFEIQPFWTPWLRWTVHWMQVG